jgi:phenylalanyl-tRNA synthetase beta chain
VSELASLEAALPDQPLRAGAVLVGARELDGWWGQGTPASWADAIEAARAIGRICRVSLDVRADACAPWHPGRCAAIYARVAPEGDGGQGQQREWLAGHAGELHPRVIKAFGLPDRTCAMELDLSVVFTAAEGDGAVQAPQLSSYPLATQDVALIVAAAVPAAEVEAALVAGAPKDLLEDVRLFDVYAGAQVGEDRKSLAYTLRFRAPDRTLTVAETTAARDAAVAEAGRQVGAVLRGVGDSS